MKRTGPKESQTQKNKFTELRKRSQIFLEARPSDVSAMTRDDIKKLVHELDTYQLELELQNEDLRNAQQELEKSGNRYIELYDFAPVGYLTVNDKGLIIEANLRAAEMLGVPRGNLLKQRFSAFILADDQDIFYYNQKKLLMTNTRHAYELRLQKKDGPVFYTQIETAINSASRDSVGQFRMVLTDISDRKALEMQLLRIKDRYRAIVMDQQDMICRFDPQGRITFVNDAYCRNFEVQHQKILGTNFLPHIHEDDLSLVTNHFKDLTQLKPDRTIEHRVYLPNGEMRWQQWCGRAFFDSEGNVIECQVVGRDITGLKNAETKLHSEVRLRQLFMDALPCVALLLRYKTHEIVASNVAGVAVGAVPGTCCFKTWGQRESPCIWCLAPEVWSTGEAQHDQFWGLGRYWDAYWIPAGDDLYLHYAFDITEMQQNREALKKAHAELEQRVKERTLELQKTHSQLLHSEKLAAVGNLSASIAHEFNNPLQSVMTIIKGIHQYVPLEEKEKKLVDLALQECNRMKKLIINLQDFYRPSSGKLGLVDIHLNIDALLLISKKDFKTRRISVKKQYADNLPAVMAVADQLKQVFLNLLNNAAYACVGGGTITIKTEVLGDSIVVHVKDNGIGIDPMNIAHIFDPFFTTKPELKGTGLGLSVSYGIIRKHGGRIEVESEPGAGTVFSVFLPIKGPGNE